MLQIESLVKVYPGPVTALQGVDLDLEVGMFGLLGPNGASKTTLMRIVAGLLEATLGVVTLDGEDILAKPEHVRARMLVWRHGGFSAHNEVSAGAEDAEGRKTLAGCMLRAPMSLQKMTYDAAMGMVIYRSKMHVGLKRNFQVMLGATPSSPVEEPATEFASRAKAIVGAAAHRAQSAARCRELASVCQLATDLSPGARPRLSCRMEKTPLRQQGVGKRLPCSHAGSRLPGNLPL